MGLFKSYSEKEVKRIMPLVQKINGLEDSIQKLSDSELKEKQQNLKKIRKRRNLDDYCQKHLQ